MTNLEKSALKETLRILTYSMVLIWKPKNAILRYVVKNGSNRHSDHENDGDGEKFLQNMEKMPTLSADSNVLATAPFLCACFFVFFTLFLSSYNHFN